MNYPFENDTERIEKRIAEKSVFSEKNRTFLIRVIILIAAFLLSFSGILLCNATLSTQQIAHVNNTTEYSTGKDAVFCQRKRSQEMDTEISELGSGVESVDCLVWRTAYQLSVEKRKAGMDLLQSWPFPLPFYSVGNSGIAVFCFF